MPVSNSPATGGYTIVRANRVSPFGPSFLWPCLGRVQRNHARQDDGRIKLTDYPFKIAEAAGHGVYRRVTSPYPTVVNVVRLKYIRSAIEVPCVKWTGMPEKDPGTRSAMSLNNEVNMMAKFR